MKLFGQLIRTAVNTALLPVAIIKDVVTLGNVTEPKTYTEMAVKKLKDEAEEDA
jgi:hypothetical protein